MITIIKKYLTLISLLFCLVALGQFPTIVHTTSILLFPVVFAIAISSIFKKHRNAYLEGKTTRTVFVRNISLEIFGILLAMVLAGFVDRYLAQIVTAQIANELAKLIAGILIGLLAGMGIGILVKQYWGQLVKTFLFPKPAS